MQKVNDNFWKNFLQNALRRMDVQLFTPDGIKMYGAHSLRGGGALIMSLSGVPLEIIKKFGRWESDAIHIYVLDAPLLRMAENVGKFLMGAIKNSADNIWERWDGEPSLQKLSKAPCIGDVIRVWYQLPSESNEAKPKAKAKAKMESKKPKARGRPKKAAQVEQEQVVPDSDRDDENVPTLQGVWIEGVCTWVDVKSFRLKFERNLQDLIVDNEWASEMRFPTYTGPSWYKVSSAK